MEGSPVACCCMRPLRLTILLSAFQADREAEEAERQIAGLEKRINNTDEFGNRTSKKRKADWHLSIDERKKIKRQAKEEADAAKLGPKQLKAVQDAHAKKKGKFPATDLENNPIKLAMFSKRKKEDDEKVCNCILQVFLDCILCHKISIRCCMPLLRKHTLLLKILQVLLHPWLEGGGGHKAHWVQHLEWTIAK